ncbi:MAG TPA: hypothetical protein VFA06_24355 [Actinocrinis sp.]|jgi:hypothetical protein|uniref:hypothetical protein n=1 Tax=Actinocrinis sp. TaxID=1920516 RepID=UPI002D69A948|nr:hypothetical protein [Actinocrinis sp.]HZU59034.1 hypothetical protein [Actinocrinis sp.]
MSANVPAQRCDRIEPGRADLPSVPPVAPRPKAPVTALTGLFLIALLGGWLIAAPFLLGDQARGAAWTAATRTDVATGAAVAGIAILGLFGYLAAAITWLARYGRWQ